MPEVRISERASKTGAHIGSGFANELSEAGVHALDVGVPAIPRNLLQAVPDAEWEQHKIDFIYESWVERASAASQSAKP